MVKRLITLFSGGDKYPQLPFYRRLADIFIQHGRTQTTIRNFIFLPAASGQLFFCHHIPYSPRRKAGIVAIVKQYSEIRIFPLKNGDYLSPVDSDNSVGESLLFGLVSLALGDFLISLALTSAFLSTNSTMAIGAESPRRKPHFNIRT